jgi:hypothetical protein
MTQVTRYPGTVTTASAAPESANDWLTPGNISADDASEAQITAATYDSPDISFQLKASNFGFTLPAGSTVNNILVEIDRRSIVASSGKDNRVQLLDTAGALVGTNKADTATVWPTTSTVASYTGAPVAYWGWSAVTETEINDPDWGVVLSALANIANADIGVDFIRVTIDYTGPPVVSSADMADSGRDFVTPFQDVSITFDVALEKSGGTPYNVGDTIPGLTVGPSGTEGAVTYRSGDSTTTWVVRRAALAKNGDTWVIDYAQGAGELVLNGGGAELSTTTNAAVTNNLTRRVRATLKRGDTGAIITTAVDILLYDADPRDSDDAAWGAARGQYPNVTPDASGTIDIEATAASLTVGVVTYLTVFSPREDSSGASAYARTGIGVTTVT